MRPRGGAQMRRRGGAVVRRTGRPTPARPTAPRRAAATRHPAAARRVVARRPLAARRLVARGSRHAPARTGRCATPNPGPADPPRQAVRKPGLVLARTEWGVWGSTDNLRLPSPLREVPRGRPRPYPPRTTEHSRPANRQPAPMTNPGERARLRPARTADRRRRSGPSPRPRTRRGCRARPPCRTVDRDCPTGPGRNTPPGPRTTARPPPGRDSPAVPRATDVPCPKDRLRRTRRRRPGQDRTTRATRRQAWPSPGTRRAPAAPPRSRPVRPGTAVGAARSAVTRRGQASPTRSTHRASSPRGTAPPHGPRGSVPRRVRVAPRVTRSRGTRLSR
jgi:hypothetical protein